MRYYVRARTLVLVSYIKYCLGFAWCLIRIFLFFFLDSIVLQSLSYLAPSVASRGRETKVSGHVVERCVSCCVNRVLINTLLCSLILHVAFLMTNAVFSLLFLAHRFEINPTGASVFAQFQIATISPERGTARQHRLIRIARADVNFSKETLASARPEEKPLRFLHFKFSNLRPPSFPHRH